jgi:outer membrane protein OmpA-like peptidoglycan-associated protein
MTTKHIGLGILVTALATACGGGASSGGGATSSGTTGASAETSSSEGGGSSSDEFQLATSDDAESAHGDHESAIQATATEAAMRLFVVDPDAGALPGIVIKLTAPDGRAYYTGETDSQGYAEVLVPAGQRYDLEYLSLGRRTTTAHVDVPSGPRQDIRLTLRYRQHRPAAHRLDAAPPEPSAPPAPEPEPEGLVLEGILFESGSATLDPESNPRLDRVVEYMTHRASARIRIEGHTDNVGNPAANRTLSEQRAQAVRAYLVSHGIDGSRVEAVGLGDAQPIASNDTEEGRAQNRRIEAVEL